MTKKTSTKNADQYNDPSHNYLRYWDGRDYEHAAEEIALRRLLKDKKFDKAIDVGGGYGRLSVVLKDFAKEVYLCEPSQQQHDIAKEFLKDKPKVELVLTQASSLPFDDASVDLAMVIRVIHHIPDPSAEFAEIARVLKPGGYFLIEFANYSNFKNRLKHTVKGQKMPVEPVDIRTDKTSDIPFVNHNPKTVKSQLAHAGFQVEDILSVSNFRSTTLKKFVPKSVLLGLEKHLQKALSKTYFGPSTVYLLKKR